MTFPIMFVWFLIGIFIFRHHMRKNSKISEKASETFWNKEEASLVVRKKDLDPSDYLTAKLDESMLKDEAFYESIGHPDLYRQQKYLQRLAAEKMVNFTHLSNTDVRLTYGTAMITTIEAYEDNYNAYIKTLYTIGKGLDDAGEESLALSYLEEGLHIGTDISKHYLQLATIYQRHNNLDGINFLIENAKGLNTLTKDAMVKDLEGIYALIESTN